VEPTGGSFGIAELCVPLHALWRSAQSAERALGVALTFAPPLPPRHLTSECRRK